MVVVPAAFLDVGEALVVAEVTHDKMIRVRIYVNPPMRQIVYMFGHYSELECQFDVQQFM